MDHPDYDSLRAEAHQLRTALADERRRGRAIERELFESKAQVRRLKAEMVVAKARIRELERDW